MLFTYKHFEEQIISLKNAGYKFITVEDYFKKNSFDEKIVVNRIDVDMSIPKAREVFHILNNHNVKASWYFRFCGTKYNLFEYATINLIMEIKSQGHEIGLHTELKDLEKICGLNPELQIKKQIDIINQFYDIKINGSACHGDITGNNNLDFWIDRSPEQFGLLYEAYDKTLWENCRYISDSEWVRWKSYENGVLLQGDNRTPREHIDDEPRVIYLLTHPDTYYHRSIHEG